MNLRDTELAIQKEIGIGATKEQVRLIRIYAHKIYEGEMTMGEALRKIKNEH